MKKVLLLISVFVFAMGAGAAAIVMIKPDQDTISDQNEPPGDDAISDANLELIRFDNQIVVPIGQLNEVKYLILSVTIEADTALADQVRLLEPKLRSRFLTILLDQVALVEDPRKVSLANLKRRLNIEFNSAVQDELHTSEPKVLITEFFVSDP